MIAIGVTLPLIVQQFDLAAGFMATFASLIVVGLLSFNQAPVWLAILVALGVSALVGLVNGALVAYAKLNSLVVTLAAGSLLFGASEIYSGGATIYQNVPKAFLAVGQSRVRRDSAAVRLCDHRRAHRLVHSRIPAARPLHVRHRRRRGGRASGWNQRWIVWSSSFSSRPHSWRDLAASFNPRVLAPRTRVSCNRCSCPPSRRPFSARPRFRPGQYNIWGTVIAVYLVGLGTTGLFMLGALSYTEPVFDGAVLLVAIVLAKLSARGRSRS